MPNLPSYRESVDRVASEQNLMAVASAARDPEILLGLAFLARTGDPVRKEIAKMAVSARSEYAPIATVLFLIMDRIDEESAGELVQRDPDNALGHYLRGALRHVSNRESEALEMFLKAAACSELRLYDSITGEALLKALDALDLRGLDRLCALSWTISRCANFGSLGIQPIHRALFELARGAQTASSVPTSKEYLRRFDWVQARRGPLSARTWGTSFKHDRTCSRRRRQTKQR